MKERIILVPTHNIGLNKLLERLDENYIKRRNSIVRGWLQSEKQPVVLKPL